MADYEDLEILCELATALEQVRDAVLLLAAVHFVQKFETPKTIGDAYQELRAMVLEGGTNERKG